MLLIAWRANIDIQFILDTYACTKYCVGYIMKSDGGVSQLLQAAQNEAKAGNFTVAEKLKKFCKILCHGCEISTQEAAASLRSQEELNTLEDESEDIFVKGTFDHYTNRPLEMEDMC